jgi:hypothetical protein
MYFTAENISTKPISSLVTVAARCEELLMLSNVENTLWAGLLLAFPPNIVWESQLHLPYAVPCE